MHIYIKDYAASCDLINNISITHANGEIEQILVDGVDQDPSKFINMLCQSWNHTMTFKYDSPIPLVVNSATLSERHKLAKGLWIFIFSRNGFRYASENVSGINI